MASDSSIPNCSPSSSFTCSNYQVFLSFRGRDVRHNFLECFKDNLRVSGIDAFTDSDDIRASEPINPMLHEIIQRAEVCIPIFSVNFPESKTCMKEVTWMVEFEKTILPIFYGIEPSVVRKQLHKNGEFFKKHIKEKVSKKTLKLWKSALEKAARRNGEVLTMTEEGYHGLIDKVIGRLWDLLRMDTQYLPKNFVDIGHHVGEVLRKLDVNLADGEVVRDQDLTGKRVVVIQGQLGIGKTTLAKAVYNKIRPLYRIQGSCFLPNVRRNVKEERLIFLQEKLMMDLQGRTRLKIRDSVEGATSIRKKFSGKGVFIVLDDVDSDWERIEELMGGLAWLGQGSKVLVTTNEKDIFRRFEGPDRVVVRHDVGELPIDKVRDLFRMHAFRNDKSDLGDFADITDKITRSLKGNPRYIELVGKILYGKDDSTWKEMWVDMARMLEGKLEESMGKLLKLLYENLKTHTQGIFLDIACLFNGMDKRIPSYLWKAHYPTWGIFELCNSSLLNLQGNELQMPDLMVLLGKTIVEDEDHYNLLNRSRLWDHRDASLALEEIQESGSAKVIALCLECDGPKACHFSCNKLSLLAALRVLRLCNVKPVVPDDDLAVRRPKKLCWLVWKGCAKASHLLRFRAATLLILDLSSTGPKKSIFALNGWEGYMQKAKHLKVLNLSGRSVESEVFPLPKRLEHLILERCSINISSISDLPKLLSLNVKHCKLIKKFPPVHKLEALEEILMDGTGIKAITLPENLMKRLKVLSARNCIKLKQIPEFYDSCNMRVLYFEGCGEIKDLPHSIEKLQQLEELDLSETMISELTPSFNRLGKLKILRMRRTYLKEFPRVIESMQFLREIDFSCCGSMKGEYVITSLSSLRILKLPSPEGSRLYMNRTNYCSLEIVEYDGELKISGIRRRNREEGEDEEEVRRRTTKKKDDEEE